MAAGATVTDQIINSHDLVMAAGAMCTVANASVQNMFHAVRLRSVEMWLEYDASAVGTAYIALQWDGTRGPGTQIGALAVSAGRPAHIYARPPPGQIAEWHNVGASDTLFSLTAQPGTIVDLVMDLVLCDPDTITGSVARVATVATLGRVYYAWLDSGSAVYFRPVLRTPVT